MSVLKSGAALLLCLGIALTSGCSITKQTTETTAETAKATYSIGSPGEAENFEFGVTAINSFSITTQYGEKQDYLLVEVTYTNLTSERQDLDKRSIHLYLDNEELFSSEYKDEFEDFFSEGLMFNDKAVNPGRTKRGYIPYRIYRDYGNVDVCCGDVTITASSEDIVPITGKVEIDPAETEATETEVTTETTVETTAVPTTELVTPTEVTDPAPAETTAATESAAPAPEA